MSAPVFLADPDDLATVTAGGTVTLHGPEGRHAVSVRRLGAGEPVVLVDGAGRRVDGTVASVEGRDRLVVAVASVADEPAPQPRIVVVQALPKGERGERAVELLTEVGVDVIVPWAASRCVAHWRGERAERGLRRWRDTAREAAKQARRSRVPRIADLAGTDDVADLVAAAAGAAVLHESAAANATDLPAPRTGDLVLVVGPEGGVSPEELAALQAAGAVPVRLGPTVLRTSSAGAVAAALASVTTGRW